MTIKELKKLIKEYPESYRVMVHGYEGNYNDARKITKHKFILNMSDSSYEGAHETTDGFHPLKEFDTYKRAMGILIG